MNPAIAVWSISADDFPEDGFVNDQLEFLLGYAILAPSNHNSQPWLFRINAMDAEIFADRRRALTEADPNGRELIMACGAALLNLRVAADYFNRVYRCEPFPDPALPDLAVRFHLGLHGEGGSSEVALFQAITRRRTNRSPYREEPLPPEILQALKQAAESEGAWFEVIEPLEGREVLANLISEADRRQWASRPFRQELARWVRTKPEAHVDGLVAHDLGIQDWLAFAGPSLIRTFDRGGGQAAKDRDIALHSPALAVLGTESDDPRSWLAAGQALQRVLLLAASENLSASFLNQPVEVTDLRQQLAAALGRSDSPQAVLRLGFGDDPPPTPRRPVRSLLIKHQTHHP